MAGPRETPAQRARRAAERDRMLRLTNPEMFEAVMKAREREVVDGAVHSGLRTAGRVTEKAARALAGDAARVVPEGADEEEAREAMAAEQRRRYRAEDLRDEPAEARAVGLAASTQYKAEQQARRFKEDRERDENQRERAAWQAVDKGEEILDHAREAARRAAVEHFRGVLARKAGANLAAPPEPKQTLPETNPQVVGGLVGLPDDYLEKQLRAQSLLKRR